MLQIKKPSLVDTKITVGKKVGTRYYQVGVQKDPPLVLKGLKNNQKGPTPPAASLNFAFMSSIQIVPA